MESDTRWVNSKLPPEKTDTGLPDEGVRLIPEIGRVKLTTLTPVGGTSESVRFSVAFPVGLQLVQGFFTPLHDESKNSELQTRRSFKNMDFIHVPQGRFDNPFPRTGWREGPKDTVTLGIRVRGDESREVLNC